MVLFAVEASAGSSGRPCGVYMFSGLTTQVFNIYDITNVLLTAPPIESLVCEICEERAYPWCYNTGERISKK